MYGGVGNTGHVSPGCVAPVAPMVVGGSLWGLDRRENRTTMKLEHIHPLTAAGLGTHGPYTMWTALRLPLAEPAARDATVARRRRERLTREAALLHIRESDRCGWCGCPEDTLYVVVDPQSRPVAALCRECVHETDDPALIFKMRHLDNEHQRSLDRVDPARRRRPT